MQPHEYSIIGHSRTTIGRYLGICAGGIASLAYLSAGAVLNYFQTTGLSNVIPEIVFWPVSAGAIYWAVHSLFNTCLWKCRCMQRLLKVPNIEGTWKCEGQTKNQEGETTFEWGGTVTISQSWEKITVRLKTSQSASNSMVAALVNEGDQGCRLIYRYTNEPKAGEPLNAHVGFCDLRFNKELNRAEGDYFNKGRWTFGQMVLTKESI